MKQNWVHFLLSLCLLALPAWKTLDAQHTVRAASSTIYVDASATGANNGSSWANAFTDLQAALAVANPDDSIWVARGEYLPGANRSDSFQIPSNVFIWGGFPTGGGNGTFQARNWQSFQTFLSCDIGLDRNPSNNCYHVVDASASNSNSILDGFYVVYGNANGVADDEQRGGGIYNSSGNTRLRNLIIGYNKAVYGGGMYLWNASPQLTDVYFANNEADHGGGVYNLYSFPTFSNVTIHYNTASESCGGILNDNSDPLIDGALVAYNVAVAGFGGGICNLANSSPILKQVQIKSNIAETYGGGMYSFESYPHVFDAVVHNNAASSEGGGFFFENSSGMMINTDFTINHATSWGGAITAIASELSLINTIIDNNTSQYGGGMYIWGSEVSLVNCTVFGNAATSLGGGVRNNASNLTITNTIFWKNVATGTVQNNQVASTSTHTTNISYSFVQGGCPSGASCNQVWLADPLFRFESYFDGTQVVLGDLRLRNDSPAIDAGNNNALPADEYDLDEDGNVIEWLPVDRDGRTRRVDIPSVPDTGSGTAPIVDMGAYESRLLSVFLPLVRR